jgi:hypothetical protein
MAAVGLVTNSGLDYLAGVDADTDCANWTVQPYSSNMTPVSTSVLSNFTLINTGGIGNVKPGFTVASASSGIKTFTSALINFIANANLSLTMYGVVIIGSDGVTLIGAYLFAASVSLNAAGTGAQVTAVLTDANS